MHLNKQEPMFNKLAPNKTTQCEFDTRFVRADNWLEHG